tara:strand:- start:1214 stop:1576 length:363 start_codon:yes stop_codon:yes gene_type:complete
MNKQTRKPRVRWDADELMYACETAEGENFDHEVYPLIAEEIGRTSQAVSASVHRVLRGDSFIFSTKEASKFKRFVRPTQRSVPEFKGVRKSTPQQPPSRQVKVQSGFSVKILWGLIEIKS